MRTKTCDLERAESTCRLGGNCTKNAERNPCQIFRAKEPSPAIKDGLRRFGKKGEKSDGIKRDGVKRKDKP